MFWAPYNDAELIAAIKGLEYAVELVISAGDMEFEHEVTLCSDSQLVLGWANGDYRFKQEEKMTLYLDLIRLVKKLGVTTRWVRGHNGDLWNERCDELANLARKRWPVDTKVKTISDSKIGNKRGHVASIWYAGVLKIVDLEAGIVEDYDREIHGKRGSVLEIRDCKKR